MTATQFAVPATITRHAHLPVELGKSRIVRIAWLVARFVRRDFVPYEVYDDRFGTSLRTFRRDLAAIRDAGLYLDVDHRGYRMVCFRPERGAA